MFSRYGTYSCVVSKKKMIESVDYPLVQFDRFTTVVSAASIKRNEYHRGELNAIRATLI